MRGFAANEVAYIAYLDQEAREADTYLNVTVALPPVAERTAGLNVSLVMVR